MTKKKELDVTKLDKVTGGNDPSGVYHKFDPMFFKYKLDQHIEKVAFSTPDPGTVSCTIKKRGYYKSKDVPCYYLKPSKGIEACHTGWYKESEFEYKVMWCVIVDTINVTTVDEVKD